MFGVFGQFLKLGELVWACRIYLENLWFRISFLCFSFWPLPIYCFCVLVVWIMFALFRQLSVTMLEWMTKIAWPGQEKLIIIASVAWSGKVDILVSSQLIVMQLKVEKVSRFFSLEVFTSDHHRLQTVPSATARCSACWWQLWFFSWYFLIWYDW